MTEVILKEEGFGYTECEATEDHKALAKGVIETALFLNEKGLFKYAGNPIIDDAINSGMKTGVAINAGGGQTNPYVKMMLGCNITSSRNRLGQTSISGTVNIANIAVEFKSLSFTEAKMLSSKFGTSKSIIYKRLKTESPFVPSRS